jgi:DNA repair protein RadC
MHKIQTQTAEIQVSYRPAISNKPIILSPLDAYNLFIEFFPPETIQLQERFVILYLNKANRALGIYPLSVGGMSGTLVDIRLILSVGLKIAASFMMLAHNHPSGNLQPSKQDIELTNKIKEAGKLIEIILLDHLIISSVERDYYSMANEGYI